MNGSSRKKVSLFHFLSLSFVPFGGGRATSEKSISIAVETREKDSALRNSTLSSSLVKFMHASTTLEIIKGSGGGGPVLARCFGLKGSSTVYYCPLASFCGKLKRRSDQLVKNFFASSLYGSVFREAFVSSFIASSLDVIFTLFSLRSLSFLVSSTGFGVSQLGCHHHRPT